MIAASNAVTRFVIEKRLTELPDPKAVENEIYDSLGKYPPEREHCLNLVIDSFRKALAEYRLLNTAGWEGDSPLVCSCFAVTEGEISEAMIDQNCTSVEDVGRTTNAGTGCGSCQQIIVDMLDNGGV